MPNPRNELRRFYVMLRLASGERHRETVDAETKQLAVRMAEVSNRGSVAEVVLSRSGVVGNCASCNGVVFDDEPHSKVKGGIRCFDC